MAEELNTSVPGPLSLKPSVKVGNASPAPPSKEQVTHRQEEKRTSAKKRSINFLSPAMPSEKRKKIRKSASKHGHLRTNDSEEPQAGPSSSSQIPETTNDSPRKLIRLLGEFLRRRCHHLEDFTPDDLEMWLCCVDVYLSGSGYQSDFFTCSGSLVFLYKLCRDVVSAEVACIHELQAVIHTCLYISYSYIGHEISYPVRPFILENRETFWKRCLKIINRMSKKMLRLNNDPQYFAQVFSDLSNQKDH